MSTADFVELVLTLLVITSAGLFIALCPKTVFALSDKLGTAMERRLDRLFHTHFFSRYFSFIEERRPETVLTWYLRIGAFAVALVATFFLVLFVLSFLGQHR
ncbi:MAG: hypothetical protein Q7R57_02260 [Dehalococcoidales bacterium]|nr:hypothetical protein [Dehalococcoidales bacterium]